MYNEIPILAPATISFDTVPQTPAQRRVITPRSDSLSMRDRSYSLEMDSPYPTTNALFSPRSPRRYRSLMYPGVKVRAASISSFRSRKSVAKSLPQSPSIRTSPSPKRNRGLGKFRMAAIIGPLKALNLKKLVLNRGGSKQKAKQKAAVAAGVCDFDCSKGLLERPTTSDVDMDSQPLSARSFPGDMDTDMEMMNLDSPTVQFATYPYSDLSDPFATPQPSATMNVDSGTPSPSSPSSMTNSGSSPGSRKNSWRFAQEAALRSQLKTLQMLGPEARTVIAMKYSHNNRI